MPIPEQIQAEPAGQPLARPESLDRITAKLTPPFRFLGDPRSFQLFDLTDAPKAALEAAGVAPGRYWLTDPEAILAEPGARGIVSRSEWVAIAATSDNPAAKRMELLLTEGYRNFDGGVIAVGLLPTLDPWTPVLPAFLPAGSPVGGYLRRTPARLNGRDGYAYHSAWVRLEVQGVDRPARPILDRELYGCWCAWLIRTGRIPAADAARVRDAQARAQGHADRLETIPDLSAEQRAKRSEVLFRRIAEGQAPIYAGAS